MRKILKPVLGIAVLTALLAATAGWLSAQSPADDPGGWTKAKWGMTRNEVQTIFPQATQVDPWTEEEKKIAPEIGKTELGLPSFPINGRKFMVAFYFSKDNRLITVHLIYQKALIAADGTERPLGCHSCAPDPQPQGKQSRAAQNAAAATAARNDIVKAELNEQIVTDAEGLLLSGLTEKYGNPSSDTRDGDRETFEWRFPSTDISLVWNHGQFKELDSVDLYYGKREKSSVF